MVEVKERIGKIKTEGQRNRTCTVAPTADEKKYVIIKLTEEYDTEEYSSRVDVTTCVMCFCETMAEAKACVKRYEYCYSLEMDGEASMNISYFIMKPGDEIEASYGHSE